MQYQLFWGDIHNHCGISYGHGSLERALTLARQQLDFASVTGHAFWPDIPTDREKFGAIIDYHQEGFAKLHRNWDTVQDTFASFDDGQGFIPFLSYEWHSRGYGDHHVLYKGTHGPLLGGDTLQDLRDSLIATGQAFILEPHHIGYPLGGRGINWNAYDPTHSPIVETYSMHGCSESDEAPYPMLNTMGPRDHNSTIQAGLERGHRFGIVASTDQHSGYPGSYGDGRLAVYASELSRDAIWDALWNRRTYAATGDKMAIGFHINEAMLGGETHGSQRQLSISAEGSDFWDTIEIIKNSKVWRRWAPLPSYTVPDASRRLRAKVHIEWGWSAVDQDAAWEMAVRVNDGEILDCETCFRGDPVLRHEQVEGVAETIPHAVEEQSAQLIAWRSVTRGNVTTRHATTQGIIVHLEMPVGATLTLTANGYTAKHTLADLLTGTRGHLTDGFRSPAVRIHRAVPAQDYTFAATVVDTAPERETDYYYARLAARNGQLAWTTPIWVTS